MTVRLWGLALEKVPSEKIHFKTTQMPEIHTYA